MFKLLNSATDYRCSHKKLRSLIMLSALAAFPISSQGQVVVESSPPCARGFYNAPAICNGWVRCNGGLFFDTLITGTILMFGVCPGYSVYSAANSYPLVNLTGFGMDGLTQLYSTAGPVLKYRYRNNILYGRYKFANGHC